MPVIGRLVGRQSPFYAGPNRPPPNRTGAESSSGTTPAEASTPMGHPKGIGVKESSIWKHCTSGCSDACRVTHGEGSPEIRFTRSAQTLLAFLLLHPHRYHPREVLAELAWGDRPDDQARAALNTALWRLRNLLEPEGVTRGAYLRTTSSGEVGFNWESNHWLDLAVFEKCASCILAIPPDAMQPEHARQLETILPLLRWRTPGRLLRGLGHHRTRTAARPELELSDAADAVSSPAPGAQSRASAMRRRSCVSIRCAKRSIARRCGCLRRTASGRWQSASSSGAGRY